MALVGVGTSLGGMTGGSSVARLLVVVSGDSSQLSNSLASATGSISNFNKNAERAGNALIRSVTLPVLALGGAALKMAMDYEAAMARVGGLTTLTAKQVAQADQRILEMSTRLGVSAVDLADSLYFAGSAGLQFSEAMQVVELSAKGAAIGMGEAEDLSKVLIFSLNAYRGTGLTAARAMDVFTAAIKEGTAAPDELALALGRLLPVARQAGVEFETAVASVAALTNIGLPTRVAATSLRALFGGLLAPTNQATETLAELGITTEQLRQAIDAGPLVAFKLLEDAVGGNDDMLRKIIPQIRGFTAYLGLSGEAAKRTAGIYNDVRNSTGSLDKAFNLISQTAQFKFHQALEQLRVGAIQTGRTLIPVFLKLLGVINFVGEGLGELGPGARQVVVAFLGLAAAVGPALKLYGMMTNAGVGLFTSFRSSSAAILAMAIAATVATASFGKLASGGGSLVTMVTMMATTFLALSLAIKGIQAAANAGLFGVNSLSLGLASLSRGAIIGATVVGVGLVTAIALVMHEMNKAEAQANKTAEAFKNLGSGATIDRNAVAKVADELGGLSGVIFAQASKEAGAWGQSIGTTIDSVRDRVIAARNSLKQEDDGFSILSGVVTGDGPIQDTLTALANGLNRTSQSWEEEAQAAIAASTAEQGALQALADEHGVSLGFAQGELSKYGVAASDLEGDVKQSFLEQAGWVEKSTGRQIAAQEEARRKEMEIIASRQEAARGLLDNLFEGKVDKVGKSTAKLVANVEKQTKSLVEFAGNVNQLKLRGLDPGALQFLVDKGPGMVAKFTDATDKELKRFEQSYYTSLGAVDAAIVNEGKHEEIKGRKNVQQFSEGMLSNRALPVGVARRIVGEVTQGLISGKFTEAAATDIERFASRLEALKGLPREAAGKIVDEFVEALQEGEFENAGWEDISRLANGIASASGLPVGKARSIASQLIGVLSTVGDNAYNLGMNIGARLAAGLVAGIPAVEVGSQQMAGYIKTRMEQDFHSSPELFTYYLGRTLADDLHRGLEDGNIGRKFDIDKRFSLRHGKAGIVGGGRKHHAQAIRGQMTITNWGTGEARFEGRIIDTMDSDSRHNRRLEKMHR